MFYVCMVLGFFWGGGGGGGGGRGGREGVYLCKK